MKCRRIALFSLSVLLCACASSEADTEIRVMHDREYLAGCRKVGILSVESGPEYFTSDPGSLSPRIRGQVKSLGGNVVFVNKASRRAYDEVWSCPVETVVAPR